MYVKLPYRHQSNIHNTIFSANKEIAYENTHLFVPIIDLFLCISLLINIILNFQTSTSIFSKNHLEKLKKTLPFHFFPKLLQMARIIKHQNLEVWL